MICATFIHFLIWSSALKVTQETSEDIIQSGEPVSKESHVLAEWMVWKEVFQKGYPTVKCELARFKIWKKNFKMLKQHNEDFEQGRQFYTVGMNTFADTAPASLMDTLLPGVPVSEFLKEIWPKKLDHQSVPDTFNWSRAWYSKVPGGRGLVPNGWAFSVAKILEAHISKNKGIAVTLSRQELLDCTSEVNGRPRITVDAFWYVLWNGITYHEDYPKLHSYKTRVNKCMRRNDHPPVRIKGFQLLQPGDEENMKIAVATLGPISVSIKVTGKFFFYKSGVFFDSFCNLGSLTLNHAVVLMGYGTDRVAGDFWVVQNNWGYQWGENGYARMARNTLADCGITSAAVYPVI